MNSILLALAYLVSMLPLRVLPAQCTAPSSAPALDHVILVVADVNAAAAEFRRLGFRVKPGRLHANGLLNQHIKFRDGSEIELMTVQGPPRDRMAQDYVDLLQQGEGGVYVALTVPDLASVSRVAAAHSASVIPSTSGSWSFASFPSSSPAAAVFFSSGSFRVVDPDSIVSHDFDASGLGEVWLEGDDTLTGMLRDLGATRCGVSVSPAGHAGEKWALSRGSLVIVPRQSAARPRVPGAVLRRRVAHEVTVTPHPAFWINY